MLVLSCCGSVIIFIIRNSNDGRLIVGCLSFDKYP